MLYKMLGEPLIRFLLHGEHQEPTMRVEDEQTMRPFIKKLENWGCQVLQATNRPNPFRGGFSIIFRCEDATARAIADLGLTHVLVDLRANTYQLRLPEIRFSYHNEGQPQLLPWTPESKMAYLAEILTLWDTMDDILKRRRNRLGLFYEKER